MREDESGEGGVSDLEEIRGDKAISPKNQFSVLGYNTRNFLEISHPNTSLPQLGQNIHILTKHNT